MKGDSHICKKSSGLIVDTGQGPWGIGTAAFSQDYLFRYRLSRIFDEALPRINFLMLNPSTADAFKLDPTVRRCMGFAKLWGMGTVEVTNIFAYRSTDPKELYKVTDPVGSYNNKAILAASSAASMTVLAWGAHGSLHDRAHAVIDMLRANGHITHVLKLTKVGQPMHPLYMSADTKPFLWPPA
jgi:hypothetical protein